MTLCHKTGAENMPKDTFFNLKEEKKEKIERALINEFSRVSFEQASVSNIIAEAKIPRGSFYQYFEDKEDAIKYVIQKFIQIEHKKMNQLLIDSNKDIFEAIYKYYNYMIESTENDNLRLIRNIFQELRKNNISIFEVKEEMKNKEDIHKLINMDKLNLEKEEDIKYFLKILTTITRAIASEVITKKISKEEGIRTIKKELEILRKGMEKR